MTNREFREWLKGFFELSPEDVVLDLRQMTLISNHLNLAEAVEGRLDEANARLRADIQVFRRLEAPDGEAFSAFTRDLRDRMLTPL